MRVVSIGAKNFISFENIEYHFEDRPIQIEGRNLTDDNQESNGSGKSGMQAILEMCVLNSNSRKERSPSLIRRGTKKAELWTELYCPLRQQTLRIERDIMKSGGKLRLSINSKEVMFSNVKDGDERILEWLDLTKEDITSYFIINQERFKSFFSSSNKEKLLLIGRLADTSVIDKADPLVKEDIELLTESMNLLEKDIYRTEGMIQGFELDIEELKKPVDDIKSSRIAAIDTDIEKFSNDIIKYQSSIETTNEAIRATSEAVTNLNANLTALGECDEEHIDLLREANDELLDEVREADKMIRKLRSNINGGITCPKCSHEFSLDTSVSIEEDREELDEFEEVKTSLEEELSETKEELEIALKKKSEFDKLEREIARTSRSLNSYNSDIEKYNGNIELLEEKIKAKESIRAEIERAEAPDNSGKIDSIQVKIDNANKEIEVLRAEHKELEDSLFEVEQWVTNFKKFKMHLANRSLQVIQGQCNANLDKMSSDLRVNIEGFKIKADGSIKEEITPLVVREEASSYHSYSGGERGRVQFAMILAIQNIINSTNKYGGLNFLSVDEVFEGIDGKGLKHLMNSIKDVGQTVLVTTHVTDAEVRSDKVTIEKVNGISRIVK